MPRQSVQPTISFGAVIRGFVEDVLDQGHLGWMNGLVALVDLIPGQQQGRKGIKQMIAPFCAAFPDIRWVIEEMVTEEDKVFIRFAWQALIRVNSSVPMHADKGEGRGC